MYALRVGKERLKTTNLIYDIVYRRNILRIEGTKKIILTDITISFF